MGLIKAAVESVGTTLHDQWKEYIKCDDLGQDVLMKKVTTKNGIITKDSAIQVSPGQIAVIFESGQILDATAEDGIYTFDKSSSPSFFAGQFGDVFKEMWKRFVFNGAPSKEQAVFYINAKEIMNNKFGSASPVTFQDWSHMIPNEMTGTSDPLLLKIMCHGTYTFKITDPAVFMSQVAGVSEEYRKDELVDQMRSDIISVFTSVINALGSSENKIPVGELRNHDEDIKRLLSEKEFDQNIKRRGISVVAFNIESAEPDEKSNELLDRYQRASNSRFDSSNLTGAYAEAVKTAAGNENGAAASMMGVGMMNMASGGVIGGAAAGTINAAQNSTPAAGAGAKFCSNCGSQISGGNFCTNCGAKLN